MKRTILKTVTIYDADHASFDSKVLNAVIGIAAPADGYIETDLQTSHLLYADGAIRYVGTIVFYLVTQNK